jgi:hypothetical protein
MAQTQDRGFEPYLISGVMVSMLASSAVDRGFECRSGQTKDYEINICCFMGKIPFVTISWQAQVHFQ